MLSDYARLKFGRHAYELIDGSTPAAERYAAVQRFKQGEHLPVLIPTQASDQSPAAAGGFGDEAAAAAGPGEVPSAGVQEGSAAAAGGGEEGGKEQQQQPGQVEATGPATEAVAAAAGPTAAAVAAGGEVDGAAAMDVDGAAGTSAEEPNPANPPPAAPETTAAAAAGGDGAVADTAGGARVLLGTEDLVGVVPPFLFLLSTRSIGLGTDLPNVDVVVLYDSDWHPRLDVQALSRAHAIGTAGRQLLLLRLYSRGCVEEKMLQLAERKRPLDAVLKPGPARSSLSGARLLEEVIRWGTQQLFRGEGEGGEGRGRVAGDEEMMDGSAADGNGGVGGGEKEGEKEGERRGSEEPACNGKGGQVVYTDELLDTLLEKAAAMATAASGVPAAAAEGGTAGAEGGEGASGGEAEAAEAAGGTANGHVASSSSSLGPGLEVVTVKEWSRCDQGSDDDASAAGEGEEEEEEGDKSAEAAGDLEGAAGGEEEGQEPLSRTDSAANTALYWENLLRPRWEQLQKEDEEHLEERGGGAGGHSRANDLMDLDRDVEGDDGGWGEGDSEEGDDDDGMMGHGHSHGLGLGSAELLHQFSSRVSGNFNVVVPEGLMGEGGELGSARGARGRGSRTLRGGRGGAGNAVGAGPLGRGNRNARRRRTDEDIGGHLGGVLMGGGMGGLGGGGLTSMPSLGGSLDGDRPSKRRRRGGGIGGGPGGGGGPNGLDQDPELGRHLEQVLREYARQEGVKALMADPTAPEHAISQRAFSRIEAIAAELGCSPELVPMACQAAEILLMMRQVRGKGGGAWGTLCGKARGWKLGCIRGNGLEVVQVTKAGGSADENSRACHAVLKTRKAGCSEYRNGLLGGALQCCK